MQVVAASPHVLLGQELAIDRATPKDRAPSGYPASLGSTNSAQARTVISWLPRFIIPGRLTLTGPKGESLSVSS